MEGSSQFHLLTYLLAGAARLRNRLAQARALRQFATAASTGHIAGAPLHQSTVAALPAFGRRHSTPPTDGGNPLSTFLFAFARVIESQPLNTHRVTVGHTYSTHTDTANVVSLYFSYVNVNYNKQFALPLIL